MPSTDPSFAHHPRLRAAALAALPLASALALVGLASDSFGVSATGLVALVLAAVTWNETAPSRRVDEPAD